MKCLKYSILLLIIIYSVFLVQDARGEMKLTYNLDRGLIKKEFRLDTDKKLYIPEFKVKGIYVTGWAAGSNRMNHLIELAERSVINTMVIDIKDQDGYLSYISDIALAREIGANQQKIKNLPALIQRLHYKGIYVIARIAVFKDSLLAQSRPDLAMQLINKETGEITRSSSWVEPTDKEVWDYNLGLALDAVAMGFDEIQFDYIRYPALADAPIGVVIPDNKTMSEVITDFLWYSKKSLNKYNIPLSIDVYGLTTTAKDDLGIGQNFAELTNIIDIISPMVYPSHYAEGSYGIAIPESQPGEIIRRSLTDAKEKIKDKDHVTIRPWLQDFSLRYRYTSKEILDQINAAESLGINEWLLWNPSSRYTEEAIINRHF
ncbi:MAG: putative glycoside hydrolase [Halanaerobiaceae bacterium]|nr:putative glycoside hydrolase [Halanaerobiaceae bacterium]